MTPTERIGRNVRCIRRAQELSQEAVAERAGVHRVLMSRYEWGQTMPKAETLLRLAGALNVGPADLLDGVRWEPGGRRFVVDGAP